MRAIPLPGGKVALIDDADGPLVEGYRWRATPARNKRTWYAVASVNYGPPGDRRQRSVRMHQLLLPASEWWVRHLDGNGLNNQRANLVPRWVAKSERRRDR